MRIPTLALALAMIAVTPCAHAEIPADGAWQVAAGSIGNELELELHNLDGTALAGPFIVTVVDAPAWMGSIAITLPVSTALEPGAAAAATVRFDVAPGTAFGTRGTITVAIGGGAESWRQSLGFEVAENPDEIQSDCCSAIEISTTGVGGADLSGAGRANPGEVSIESFPNPSNPATSIRFTLGARERVTITVHDVSGRLIRTLFQGLREAGRQDVAWDGRMDRGEPAPSGIYFVRIEAGGATHSAKLALTR